MGLIYPYYLLSSPPLLIMENVPFPSLFIFLFPSPFIPLLSTCILPSVGFAWLFWHLFLLWPWYLQYWNFHLSFLLLSNFNNQYYFFLPITNSLHASDHLMDSLTIHHLTWNQSLIHKGITLSLKTVVIKTPQNIKLYN